MNTLKLLVDSALALAVLLLMSIILTGLALHEWLGLALIVTLLVHLLSNWAWIVATLRRCRGALPLQVRMNFILNAVLFITMTVVIASGLLISRVALPFLGLDVRPNTFLSIVHLVSADLLLIVAGLHLGLNWKWIILAVRRQMIAPLRRRVGRNASVAPSAATHPHRS